MQILMLLADQDFPPDIRVEKEVRSLSAVGHKVVVVCNQLREGASEDRWEGCQIKRLPLMGSWPVRKLKLLKRRISFYDRYWDRSISELIEKDKADVIHVHDLPMVGTALGAGRRYNIPVVADLHENYPAAIRFNQPIHYTLSQIILSFLNHPSRWEAYERRCALAVDKVLVVVEEAKIRLIEAGIPGEKIEVVENTPDVEYFLGLPIDEGLVAQYKNDFVICYIGKFGGQHRGLDTAVEAMPGILKEIPNARLLLVGKGSIKPVLEKIVAELSLESKVTFVDWQPFEKVPTFVALSAVCLVPHHSNPHTEATSPHKLFQYMLMGKPVVVSSCKPLKRVIEETGSGLTFKAGDSEGLVRTVVKLKNEELRQKFGEAGRHAVLEKYNWRKTSRKLLKVYEKLAKRKIDHFMGRSVK